MDSLQSIIGQLFSLDPSRAPDTLHGAQIAPGRAASAAAEKNPIVDDSSAGKVLATLQGRSTPKSARGPLGLPVGPLPDVKGKSKGSAFATGLAAGMNNYQNAQAADNKSAETTAANNLKTMSALFTAQQQEKANDIREQNAASLRKYYEGIVENGRRKADGKDLNEHQIEMTRTAAAKRFGLYDQVTAKDMSSPIPSIRDAATKRYEQRRAAYDAWEKSFNSRIGAGAEPAKAATDAHIKTGTDGSPDAGGGPATPPADPAKVKPAAGKPAAAAPAEPAPQTWQPIRNQKDGSMWLFNPATGEKKPADGQTAPAAPSPSFPSPPAYDESGAGTRAPSLDDTDTDGDE